MRLFKHLCVFVLLWFSQSLVSQCNLTLNQKLIDSDNNKPDTTNIPILVTGALNNNLSTPQQGVCGVSIKFKHPFVKELFIELISPNGQKVRLVGGDITSYFTDLITWDVTFVPCMSTASPDPGFLPKWENDQGWQQLTTYNGQYFPNQGCLENFTAGTVNGTWTIRCIDNVDGGEGIVQSASIIFCQANGIICGQCKTDPGVINNPDLSLCEGDQQLNIIIDKTYPNFAPNTSVYTYQNVVFKNGLIHNYTTNTDFRTESSGSYTICGIQYVISNGSLLPVIGSAYTEQTLSEYFLGLGACAAVSDSCMRINISKKSPVVSITQFICKGDIFDYQGKTYTTAGIYDVVIPNGVCDSLVKLEVRVIDIPVSISADRDVISCLQNTNGLIINPQLNNVNYQWYTTGGLIEGNPQEFAIDAKAPGDYCAIVSLSSNAKICIDTFCKTITPDFSFPKLTFEVDTLDCSNNSMTDIRLISTIPLTSALWTSKEMNLFTPIPNNSINVTLPGTYYAEVISQNGCKITDSVEVFKDLFTQTPRFSSGLLSCETDTTYINVSIDSIRNYRYEWGTLTTENTNRPLVLIPGIYNLTLTDDNNGCFGVFPVKVEGDIAPPKVISFSMDTINCNRNIINPIIVTDSLIRSYEWNIGGIIQKTETPNITKPGDYQVTIVQDNNGCEKVIDFTVFKDTDLPEISYVTDSISCLKDSAQISITPDRPILSYTWSALGFNFFSTDKDPIVKLAGTYILEVVSDNGCKARTEIIVPNSVDIPNVIMQIDSFRCGLSDTIRPLVSFVQDAYIYEWAGPGLIQNNILDPQIILPGEYSVTITNPVTGCKVRKQYAVFDNRIKTDIALSALPLDCNKDSVQIVLANTDIVSATYMGPGINTPNVLNPFVSEIGTYTGIFVNAKNCTSIKTIQIVSNDALPVISIDYLPFKCGDNQKNIDAKSNIPGTVFSWETSLSGNPNTASINILKGEKQISLTGLAPNGCESTSIFTLVYDTLVPNFNILNADPLFCKDSIRTLKTSYEAGTGTIVWLPAAIMANEINVNRPGTYIAILTENNNCIARDTIIVVEDKVFPAFAPTSTIINCKEQKSNLKLNISSPFTEVRWSAVNPEIFPINTTNFSTSFGGIFRFEVENIEGCIEFGEILVEEDKAAPIITTVLNKIIDCSNPISEIGFSLTSGIRGIIWNGPNTVDKKTDSLLMVTEGGLYYASIEGNNYCRKDTSIRVEKNVKIPTLATFTDTLTCDKGKINIGVSTSGDIKSYLWSGPTSFESQIYNPLIFRSGLYLVTVTGNNGCTSTASIDVVQDIIKPIILVQDTFFLPCDSSAIALNAASMSEIKEYKWIFPDGTIIENISPMTSAVGKIYIQLSGLNGCFSELDSTFIQLNRAPPGFTVVTDTITCANPIATLSASSPESDISYLWSSIGQPNNTSTLSSLKANIPGQYRLIVTNSRQCRDTLILNVPIDTIRPKVVINPVGQIQCKTANLILNGSDSEYGPGFAVAWSTINGNILETIQDISVKVDKEGLYRLDISNIKNGCTGTDTYNVVKSNQGFTQVNIEKTSPSCENIYDGRIILTGLNGESPFTVLINGKPALSSLTFANLQSGNYEFIIEDAFGCVVEQKIFLEPAPDLDFGIEKEFIIKYGDSITLMPQYVGGLSSNAIVSWVSKGDTICRNCSTLTVMPFVNTVYTITFGINTLCSKTENVLVRVINDLDNAVPNIFSPTAQSNNLFYIPQTRGIQKILDMKVFGRWAEAVYEAYDIDPGDSSFAWDGTFKGKTCVEGVYLVVANCLLEDGSIWTYRGDITLIR